MEEPPPRGSLPVQSTNFVSHLLSLDKAVILRPALGSMMKNIRTLALCTDLTPFRLYVRAVARIFSELTEQSVNKCLLVHSGNMVLMALLSLILHLSHSGNEAERIIYILKLFYETSCSTKSLVHTMRLVVHNSMVH